MKLRFVAAALLTAVTLVSNTVASRADGPANQANFRVEITQFNNTPVQEGKVTKAGGFNVLPSTKYDGGEHTSIDEDLEQSLILTGLKDVKTLRAWVLCAAELHAEATLLRGYADATFDFPRDAPLNQNVNWRSHQKRDWTKPNKFDADYANERRAKALVYDQAASIAEASNLPCTDPFQASSSGNYVRLIGYNADGKQRTLDIPDYSVVDTPLEYYMFTDRCPDDMIRQLRELQAAPLDTKPGKRGSFDTFSERDKARGVVWLTVQLRLLRVARGYFC
jgi:hypothetical protein